MANVHVWIWRYPEVEVRVPVGLRLDAASPRTALIEKLENLTRELDRLLQRRVVLQALHAEVEDQRGQRVATLALAARPGDVGERRVRLAVARAKDEEYRSLTWGMREARMQIAEVERHIETARLRVRMLCAALERPIPEPVLSAEP